MIARTSATGSGGVLAEVLRFTTSLPQDRALLQEDLLGSLAHVTMLTAVKLIPHEAGATLRRALIELIDEARRGDLILPEEEDVHMAVERLLTARLGDAAGRLHTARSRNDQVALDLRLHVRESIRLALGALAKLLNDLAARAALEQATLMPAYTHRQRAQPISVAYLLCGYGMMFARDIDALAFAAETVDASPLGVGALAGTGLPIDRQLVAKLLHFGQTTGNGLDTVGDRDFALDLCYAAARCQLHASRVASDLIDYASSEFGLVRLGDEIAFGSSLMPQKKNPDLFELVRGKSSQAIGHLVQLLALVKGLPTGYQRDLQEDRSAILSAGPLLVSVLEALRLGLAHVTFDGQRGERIVTADYMQAVDLVEALVEHGLPFREAYQVVGTAVAQLRSRGEPLCAATAADFVGLPQAAVQAALLAADPAAAVARKESLGGTGARAVTEQIASLEKSAQRARRLAEALPSLTLLAEELRAP